MSEKIVLITGASSGIGKATALKLASNGYKLILTARRKELLDEIVSTVGSEQAIAVKADVTAMAQLEKVVDKGIEKFGRINVVFANAGIGLDKSGTESGDPEQWDRLIDINIKGLLWTAKLTLPYLHETKGHFLVTSSIAGKIHLDGSIYGASKWFAYGLGQNLAREMKKWGGRCTTICPGMVNTEFFNEPVPDKLDPIDIADAVLYAIQAPQRNTIREIEIMPTN